MNMQTVNKSLVQVTEYFHTSKYSFANLVFEIFIGMTGIIVRRKERSMSWSLRLLSLQSYQKRTIIFAIDRLMDTILCATPNRKALRGSHQVLSTQRSTDPCFGLHQIPHVKIFLLRLESFEQHCVDVLVSLQGNAILIEETVFS